MKTTPTQPSTSRQPTPPQDEVYWLRFLPWSALGLFGSFPSKMAVGILCISIISARSQLVLTDNGGPHTFGLTTFASGFQNSGEGPTGMAFWPDGSVLVSDDKVSQIQHFPYDSNGQDASTAPVTANYQTIQHKDGNATCLATLRTPGGGERFFLTQQTPGMVLEVNPDGSFKSVVATIGGALGLIPFPPDISSFYSGHLFVSGSGKIWDVNPDFGTATPVIFNMSGDSMVISPDGSTIYVADRIGGETNLGSIQGFNIGGWSKVYDSLPFATGIDGLALGGGTLTGYIYANCNDGNVWEVGLPGGPEAGVERIIATGGTRGDFAHADPFNGTMLLTQTASIIRLIPPRGGIFFGGPSSTRLAPGLVYQNDGTGSAQISFSAQPFTDIPQANLTFILDSFTGNADVMTSPGGGFNQTFYVNPNMQGTPGIIPLGLGVSAALPPLSPAVGGLNFGGGAVALLPSLTTFDIQDAANPGDNSSSLATAAWTAEFVNGTDFTGNLGTVLALKGLVPFAGGAWASLVTYFTDLNTGNTVVVLDVLAASGTAFSNLAAVWTGVFGSALNGNGNVIFDNGGTTFSGVAVANFPAIIPAFDRVRQTSVLTLMADSTTVIESANLPSNLTGITLPDMVLVSTETTPVQIASASMTDTGFVLQWNSTTDKNYKVEWTPTLTPPSWTDFTNVITSTNNAFIFIDDGSQTGGLGSQRFYRLVQQ